MSVVSIWRASPGRVMKGDAPASCACVSGNPPARKSAHLDDRYSGAMASISLRRGSDADRGFGRSSYLTSALLVGSAGLIDLVEVCAVLEVRLVGLVPAAERFLDGEERNGLELSLVLLGGLGIARAIVVLASDVLAFRRVEV